MQMENIEQKATLSPGEKTQGEAITTTEKFVKTKGEMGGLNGTCMWTYMASTHDLSGEQLNQLQQAMIPAKIQGKRGTLVRVFDPNSCEAKVIVIKDFDSLNQYPQQILYEGYFFGQGGGSGINVEKRKGTGPSLLEQMLQEGSITEVGMIVEDSTGMKWLKGFGKFLMMGGFLLVIVLAALIFIAISVLTK
jgi:hypothetical protein